MIDQDKRQAIYCLHKEGMGQRKIARSMRISANTVTSIIRQQGLLPEQVRKDKITIDEAILRKVYQDCNGRKQRIHEILTEDHDLDIGYSTLTRLIRELEISDSKKNQRCSQVPAFITAPYREHRRVTDQYGYVSVDGNYYWVPGTGRHDVTVLEYSNHLKIYNNRRFLGEYELPPKGTKNKKTGPEGQPPPVRQPHNRKKPTAAEEKHLREISSEVSTYIDEFVIPMSGKKRHGFIRQLYRLKQNLTPSLFSETLARAFTYHVTDIDTIKRIAVLQMQQGNYMIQNPDVDMTYKNRKSFLDGQFVDEVDLTTFDDLENSHG